MFLCLTMVTAILSACGKSADKNQTSTIEEIEPDSVRYERLRAEEAERQAQIEASLEKAYLWSDTIPFGDLSIMIKGASCREDNARGQQTTLNRVMGRSDTRTASIKVTFVNNGTKAVQLPYAHFAAERAKKKNQEGANNIISMSGQDEPTYYIASRLMTDARGDKFLTNMTLKPGKKVEAMYLSVLNKTSQWLLRFTNEQQVLDTDTSEGKQMQNMLDNQGMEISIITDDYEGTSAYVDLNEIL